MHIYGTTGYAFLDDAGTIRYRLNEKSPESVRKIPKTEAQFNDPFTFFAAAIRGTTVVSANDLSSLKTNMTVVEILEAARKSSKTGKRIALRK
jgi:predicted dehydrogenase